MINDKAACTYCMRLDKQKITMFVMVNMKQDTIVLIRLPKCLQMYVHKEDGKNNE